MPYVSITFPVEGCKEIPILPIYFFKHFAYNTSKRTYEEKVMLRDIDLNKISDGKLYGLNDMAPVTAARDVLPAAKIWAAPSS